jgi:hypothetical protein
VDELDAYQVGLQCGLLDRLVFLRDHARRELQSEDVALLDAWVRGYLDVIAELLTQHDRAHRAAALQVGPGHRAPLRPAGDSGDGAFES